jgi:prepilin-type N-terminal cleavage/methylation domain-containing protein
MQRTNAIRTRGFTLAEMLLAMALGLIVLGAAVQLFTRALDATFVVTQRAEMQQNGRASVGLIAQDISLAGAGLPTSGVQLPTGTVTSPIYGCGATACYVSGVNPAGIAYPNKHLYGVIPGYQMGMPTSAGGNPTDVITVTYTDNTFALDQYTVTAFPVGGGSITMSLPPAGVPALADPAVGIKLGDLLMIQNDRGAAIGEVTGLAGNDISFANSDPLQINQSTATSGNVKAVSQNVDSFGVVTPLTLTQVGATKVTRILVVTYYLNVPPGPDGLRYTADDFPPQLMRQLNGQKAAPVAQGIADLQFSYDIFDDATAAETSNLRDAGIGVGKNLNQIRKVNIVSMTARSQLHGAKGFQGLDLATSVTVRNMSFRDRYK